MDRNAAPVRLPYMQNRELSWLAFNKRVLDQGADATVPLLDRLNFISIFWSNLQEFFMVRVGSLTDLALVKKSIIDSKSGMTPAEQLDAIYARCHELYPYYEHTYEDLRAQLAAEGIENVRAADLSDDQRSFLDDYVHAQVMPFLSPQIINARHPFPHLENGALYIVVRLDERALPKKDKKARAKDPKADKAGKAAAKEAAREARATKDLGAVGVTLGLIPLPRQCDRVVQLPGKGTSFILLEHVIEMYAAEVFSMYKVKHTNVICVTRNADLDATEGTDEHGDDYREHMKRILKKRSRLAPVRLESERELSSTVKPLLLEKLGLKEHQTFVTSVPLDLGFTWGLAGRVSAKKRAALAQTPFTPQWPACLDRNRPIIDQVSEREVLLSYPYESMDAFVQLLREAAADPKVISIKITLYRLASHSHLAEALIAAAEAGKEVTALFELRARFDESNNIEWSQRFEQAGCHVIYGFRDFKVHSKVCCITRQTDGGLQHITQLGTGNYNEKTARLYTDFSFITSDPSIGRDAVQFFRNMALENASDSYDILWVAPLQIKQNIIAGIDEQIALARKGEPCGLYFKTNSVTDKEVIDKIAEASQAGVDCTLFVRGISCIVPGVEGFTDRVRVVSIVGRLLEHSRIYCFGPLDDCKVYLSSADLMTRNMDKRIEIAWPILNNDLRDQVLGYLATCMSDTAKLRELLPTSAYTELGYFAEAGAPLFDSQNYLIAEAQRKHLAAAELEAHREANRISVGGRAFAHEPLGEEVSEFVDVPAIDEDEATTVAGKVFMSVGEAAGVASATVGAAGTVAAGIAAGTAGKAAEAEGAGAGAGTGGAAGAAEAAVEEIVVEATPVEDEAASDEVDEMPGELGGESARAHATTPSPEQIERAKAAARSAATSVAHAAGSAAVVAGGVAASVAKSAGSVAADAAKQMGASAADAARSARSTTARAARQAARNAGTAAADAAKQAAEAARENALARREAPRPAKRPGLLSRLLGALGRRK
ncbi:polyphosphate kinase 1 [Adlercreutzia sp. ZJ242]|uniref:polyphosphate kinase 1 n=1 Tax=Adlercreutzia sp. ZJ242 TaxID=2709409 RepID=UPI0013E9CD38|nr:polyphosphate kinase 1 [Adlercreutzia sp. ZJ242]